jgi:hypothetical protein
MRATIHNYFITVICVLLLLPFSLIFIPVSDRELNGVTETGKQTGIYKPELVDRRLSEKV